MVRTRVNSMSVGPWWYFVCCEVRPLISSHAVWNTMMVDQASVSSRMGVWAEVLQAEKANPYPECLLKQEQDAFPSMTEVI